MTVKEAAKVLDLSYFTVLALIRAGRLGCQRRGLKGGKMVVTQDHIDRYLESCERPGNSPAKKLKHITIRH